MSVFEYSIRLCYMRKEQSAPLISYRVLTAHAGQANVSTNFHNLPVEIHLRIFDLLETDPVTSTCLGLTCKKLYPMHVVLHCKVGLAAPYHEKCDSMHLATLLENWTGIPAGSVYDAFDTQKFVSAATHTIETPANMI